MLFERNKAIGKVQLGKQVSAERLSGCWIHSLRTISEPAVQGDRDKPVDGGTSAFN